jgi:caffeoyl-CoA O-methyltransferase
VYALDIEPFLKEFTAPYFEKSGLHKRIEVVVGPASESIDKLAKRGVRFDIAFLDADKSGYLGYYKQLMDNDLIVPGGIVVVDNSLMKVSVRYWLHYSEDPGILS